MRKFFLMTVSFVLCSSLLFAEGSIGFSVIWSVIDSLHSLDWGSTYELAETDDEIQMMTKLMNQNSKYEAAGRTIEKYINDKDENISTMSKAIAVGSFQLVDANNKIIDKLRKLTNLDKEGLKDVEYTIAETNAQKKKAWEMITMSVGFSMPIIMEFAKTDNPTGKIPYKLSEKDRQLLIKRINELFGEKLEKLKNFLELSKQGKETNPNDSTYIIMGVKTIRNYLISETYEEAQKKVR